MSGCVYAGRRRDHIDTLGNLVWSTLESGGSRWLCGLEEMQPRERDDDMTGPNVREERCARYLVSYACRHLASRLHCRRQGPMEFGFVREGIRMCERIQLITLPTIIIWSILPNATAATYYSPDAAKNNDSPVRMLPAVFVVACKAACSRVGSAPHLCQLSNLDTYSNWQMTTACSTPRSTDQ
jgi:hypothetical protein